MSRPGASLAEAVTVLALSGVMLAAVARYAGQLAALHRIQVSTMERARTLETARTVLEAELRYLAPGRDLAGLASDSLAGRFFRGMGRICGEGLRVHYRGIRAPDPDKDSLLFAGGADPRPFALRGLSPDLCADGTPALRLAADTAPRHGVVLLFEHGSYHVGGGGLRYRIGRAGRQPLTGPLEPAGARFAPLAGTAADTVGIAITGGLRDGAPRLQTVPFLNAPRPRRP